MGMKQEKPERRGRGAERNSEPPGQAERREAKKEARPLQVKEVALVSLATLEQRAWCYLGTMSHPETGKVQLDLGQARLAIDCIEALANVLRGHLSAEEKSRLEFSLTNLRLNYVTRASKSTRTQEPKEEKGN